ncbi:hypothetical protein POTOM_026028 [Populus tomentosa]|uniref:Uncharacterized protein n=1 Tax=Populus tomentosa TaxID=118781 RepID=A0A8X7ZWG3_POPTO|nr:hypothetical protein POTOM_026028 [Populus tomentosa]
MNSSSSLASFAKRLAGKVAIITGGASGIGESTSRLFVEHGTKVIIADVQDHVGQSLCKELGTEDNVYYVHCNIDPTILGTDNEDFKRVFEVSVYGGFLGAKHAARVMIPVKKGVILFTSSVASVACGESPHAYTMSKHAVVGLMKNLCVELGQYGIRVNCISPCALATPLLRNAMGADKSFVEHVVCESANLKGVVPSPKDVAEAAFYLGSDESKYVSGLNLMVDGGYSTTNQSLIWY